MSADDKDDWIPIHIAGPLPLGVAGGLMTLIGTAWPEAVVDTSSRSAHALAMRIPPGKSAATVEETATALRDAGCEDGVDSVEFRGFEDGWMRVAPPQELCLHLGDIAHRIFVGTEGAMNYVEWTVRTQEEDEYVLSIAKSKGQTPGALRTKAEAYNKKLMAALMAAGIPIPEED